MFSAQKCPLVAASRARGSALSGQACRPAGKNSLGPGPGTGWHRVWSGAWGCRALTHPTVTSAPSGTRGLYPGCRLMCFWPNFDHVRINIIKKKKKEDNTEVYKTKAVLSVCFPWSWGKEGSRLLVKHSPTITEVGKLITNSVQTGTRAFL